jgi:hypothetical protein
MKSFELVDGPVTLRFEPRGTHTYLDVLTYVRGTRIPREGCPQPYVLETSSLIEVILHHIIETEAIEHEKGRGR